MAVGDLLIGWQLLHQAAMAIAGARQRLPRDDRAFYEGKIAVASFFARNFLPLLTSTRRSSCTLDNDMMELDEAAF